MLKNARVLAIAMGVGACFAGGPSAFSQQPDAAIPAAPRFTIERFDISGATLIDPAALQKMVAPYTGPGKDFGDVQRAVEVIENAYRGIGYAMVQAQLPEQDITRGVVQLRIVEPRIGRVIVEGNKFFNEENIRYSLPSIREGQTPNSGRMSRNLQMLEEHPTKQTSVSLRAGASEDQVDAVVKVTDEKPWRAFFTLDNTGSGDTGYLRAGIGYQHSNLFNRDHTLTAQYITSPDHIDDVTILGLGYRIPFYNLNSSLDLIAGYSDVNSGNVQGLFNVAGSGTILLGRWNYFLPRWGEWNQKVSFGLDYRAFKNDVNDPTTGVPTFAISPITGLVHRSPPDVTIHPASVTYTGQRRFADGEFSFYGSGSANIAGGSDGDGQAFTHARVGMTSNGTLIGADSSYTLMRFGFTYLQAFAQQWQMRVAVNGQYTRDLLVPGEQFGIGGPDSVRGYQPREVSKDKGYQGQFEIYSPDVAQRFKMSENYRLRFLGFYDYGAVQQNDPLPGESSNETLKSAGLGLRLNYGKLLSLRVDIAQILQPTPNRQSDSQRLSAALAIVY